MLEIISNGSKWFGEAPDTINDLIKVMGEHTLDPIYEKSGGIINAHPHWCSEKSAKKYNGCTIFSGNFIDISHVFYIVTDEQPVIAQLSKVILTNINSAAYKEAKIAAEKEAIQNNRKVMQRK